MTKTTKTSANTGGGPKGRHRNLTELRRENDELRAEMDRMQSLYGAALLTATAFRLRDRDAETKALRLLVQAIDGLEDLVQA